MYVLGYQYVRASHVTVNDAVVMKIGEAVAGLFELTKGLEVTQSCFAEVTNQF